ncbi:carbamoyltransferase [Phaeobacter sp. QD34_3]|uniref:carbamoyltransferase family protein n=1 Tax=unclassified Phaeobacter TaxID=2621772 RepID=UPI00237F2E16|nr:MULTISPECIES: carbamoyltransferase [unclassified Phaeobacter]MDE4133894.1 carbamoyltransferase [Phaeobacter sp. QD34_3]MDE4137415.1 carbamoyltransferase [Phaeobacter sp. QD34_24]
MKILGLSAFYHDSAAALLVDGKIIAAAQEERFTRKKFDPGFPKQAIQFCLDRAGCDLSEIDHVVFHEKPLAKFERMMRSFADFAPRGFWAFRQAMPLWLGSKLWQKRQILAELAAIDPAGVQSGKLLFAEHHQSHAASAFYPSPFEDALVLTLDGVGEWATGSVCLGRGSDLVPELELDFPNSLGLLYTAITQYLGFKVLSGEYKVMGLAPYGEPRFRDLFFDHLVDLKEDGSFSLDQRYFDYCVGQSMISDDLSDLFGQPARRGEAEPLTQFHMDVAASLQVVTEEIVLRMVRSLMQRYDQRNLCLAGGVALNCVANGRILRETGIDGLWIQPAAGDAGCALGAALAAHHQHLGQPRAPATGRDAMQGAYLGPDYAQSEIEDRLTAVGASFEALDDEATIARVAEALEAGKAVGWFQGRMEFGPRALGARSILADARSEAMQKVLNLKVKNRESFRPFAPVVLEEDASDWFEHQGESPYMLITAPVHQSQRRGAPGDAGEDLMTRLNQVRSTIPAVTHVDYSARLQTVSLRTNPALHRLLSAFKHRTGCPVLVNTSFNVRGEPIVCTPEDAFRCFMGTEIDVLVAGNCILEKEAQDPALRLDYKSALEPD